MQLDSDPAERALRQAVKGLARAAFDGEKDTLRAAREKVASAIAAFPQERQEALQTMTRRRVREELEHLHQCRAEESAAAEARELNAMREQYDAVHERSRGPKR